MNTRSCIVTLHRDVIHSIACGMHFPSGVHWCKHTQYATSNHGMQLDVAILNFALQREYLQVSSGAARFCCTGPFAQQAAAMHLSGLCCQHPSHCVPMRHCICYDCLLQPHML